MKKRILILTSLLAITTFVLAGCGRSSVGTTQSSSMQNSANPVQTETTKNPTTTPQSGTTSESASGGTRISAEEARRTALERVPGATESDIRIHLEMDDRIQVYDGEIIYNQKEYDFEIDAETGEILEWSEDTADYLD